HLDGEAPTVDGRTLAAASAEAPTPDGRVLFRVEEPFKPHGSLHSLRGNLAPDGSLLKLAGTERTLHAGPARVFDGEEACADAVRAGEVEADDVLVIRYE